jgi:hypothetical protein
MYTKCISVRVHSSYMLVMPYIGRFILHSNQFPDFQEEEIIRTKMKNHQSINVDVGKFLIDMYPPSSPLPLVTSHSQLPQNPSLGGKGGEKRRRAGGCTRYYVRPFPASSLPLYKHPLHFPHFHHIITNFSLNSSIPTRKES